VSAFALGVLLFDDEGEGVCERKIIISQRISSFNDSPTLSLGILVWTGTCAVGAFAAGAPLFDDEGEGVCERKIIISQRISSFNDSPTLSLGILV
jgi:hypothetical protein